MKKQARPLIALFLLITTVLACSSSFNIVETPLPSPVQSNLPTEDAVDVPSYLLPHVLFYLADGQVFRMERDGKTVTQLTSEPVNVTDYDVATVSGNIAYTAGGQLILANADGSNRLVIASGSNPAYSPDGRILAYRQDGLTLYDFATGASNKVFEDRPLGGTLPPEIYVPDKFSPDGTKLLVKIGHPPDSPWTGAIYSLATNTLTQFAGESESITCCTQYGGAEWASDSSSFYAVASVPDSSFPGGELWKVDADTGAVTTLTSGSAGDGDTRLIYFPYKPYLAPDGQIYFFMAKYPESAGYFRRAPLLIIRSVPGDIITNWTVMRPETFELMNEALWAPDASFVIVALSPVSDVYDGGQAKIFYLDGSGRPDEVLISSAQLMKWGP